MITSILKTDGGPHPASKWAEATAGHIVQIGEHVAGAELVRARRFELTVMDIVEAHHATVQDGERGKIVSDGHDRILAALDPSDHLSIDDAVGEIVAASVGTTFETHFAQPFVRAYLVDLLTQHFRTSMHVERSWHADRNPATKQALQFRAIHHGEATV